jgi:hypothetical protein
VLFPVMYIPLAALLSSVCSSTAMGSPDAAFCRHGRGMMGSGADGQAGGRWTETGPGTSVPFQHPYGALILRFKLTLKVTFIILCLRDQVPERRVHLHWAVV